MNFLVFVVIYGSKIDVKSPVFKHGYLIVINFFFVFRDIMSSIFYMEKAQSWTGLK